MPPDRYWVSTNEDYEPNSKEQVLKNLLGIKDKQIIEALETEELERTSFLIPSLYGANHQFTVIDICDIHAWLANIYPFAGKYRQVNMSKAGFHFASSQFLTKGMDELEIKYLKKYTPCNFIEDNALAYALGIIHVEFIFIHPFREGNGRVARLLANLMALQAGRDLINYTPIDKTRTQKGYDNYIHAIHKGVLGDYGMIQKVFLELLKAT